MTSMTMTPTGKRLLEMSVAQADESCEDNDGL
jgi:hypothetical protein